MPPQLAALVFFVGIGGLFVLDRERARPTSIALWIPITWLVLAGSRNFSVWLGGSAFTASPDQYLEGSPMDRALLSGMIAVGIGVLVARGQRAGDAVRKNAPLLLFLFYCALSTAWSDFPFVALKRYTKAVGNVVMALIVLTDGDPATALKKFLTRTAFLLVPLSVLLIKFYPAMGRYYDQWEGTMYYSGVTTDKNMLGGTCLVLGLGTTLAFVEAMRKAPHRSRRLLAIGALLAMNVWLLSTANSATSLACFTVGAALILLLTKVGRGQAWFAHVTVAALLTIAAAAYLFPDAYVYMVGSMGRNTTLTGRTELWADLFRLVRDPWFGEGFESFFLGDRLEFLWAKYWWHPNEAHNGYIETYLTLGRVGLVLLGLLVVTGYRNAVSVYRRDPLSGSLRLAIVVIAPIYNYTEAAFKVMNPVWILFLLAVTAVPDVSPQEQEQRAPEDAKAIGPAAQAQAAAAEAFIWKSPVISRGPARPIARQQADVPRTWQPPVNAGRASGR